MTWYFLGTILAKLYNVAARLPASCHHLTIAKVEIVFWLKLLQQELCVGMLGARGRSEDFTIQVCFFLAVLIQSSVSRGT